MTQESAPDTPVPELPPGTVYDLFRAALPGVQMTAEQAGLDVAVSVRREDLLQVMETVKGDERLAFDFLRSLSGVDYLDELEVVYHLYSYSLGHGAAIKSRCPPDDAHMPTVSHLWQTANWHEREAAEMFGFVFDGLQVVLLPLLDLGQRVRLAQDVVAEPLLREQGAQVGVAVEDEAEHLRRLPLVPVGGLPEVADRRHVSIVGRAANLHSGRVAELV